MSNQPNQPPPTDQHNQSPAQQPPGVYGQPPVQYPYQQQYPGYAPPGMPPYGAPPPTGAYYPPQGYPYPQPPYGQVPAPMAWPPQPQQSYAPPQSYPGQPQAPAQVPGQPPTQPPGQPPTQPSGQPQVPQSYPYQQPFGAFPPAPQPFGVPSYGVPSPYGGPAPYFLGVPIIVGQAPQMLPDYDPSPDVESLKKATKGFGTDNSALIRIMTSKSATQMAVLTAAFLARNGKSLEKVIKSETSGYYESVLVALCKGPLDYDAFLLREACKGAGTKETVLTELLVGRNFSELSLLRHAYRTMYNQDMDSAIRGELSMKTQRAFEIVLQGRWDEGPPETEQTRIDKDVRDLAGAMRIGSTDEMLVSSILFARSPNYLASLSTAFQNHTKKTLEKVIKDNFQGHMESALIFAAKGGNSIQRDAEKLESAMSGTGTKDEQLIWRIVRAHWDVTRFQQIQAAYKRTYGKDLRVRVASETSGDYKKTLVTLCE